MLGPKEDRSAAASSTSPPRVRPAETGTGGYEERRGGEGRQVFFRPERYGADAFGLVQPVLRVVAVEGREPFECRLHDVSQNGVALHWERPEAPPAPGALFPRVTVSFGGYTAYDGAATVSSVRGDEAPRLVGLAFTDSLMDVEDVLALRDVRAWEARNASRISFEGKPWRVTGHDAFKAGVAEFRLFLEDAQAEFESLETEFPSHVFYRDVDSAARAGLIDFVRAQFVRPFVAYSEAIDALLRPAAPAEWQQLREYSLRQIQHFMMRSQFFRRSLHKPLGYPGDYRVLSWIYDHPFEGPALFDRAMDHGTLAFTAAEAVRGRKRLLREMLWSRLSERAPDGPPLRVVSVASGPAQEFLELLESLEEEPPPLEVVLFDQDKEALSYAYGRLRRLALRRFPERVRVTFLHDSIRRLLHAPDIFGSFGPFDVVVCAGLFDYLSDRTALALAAKLYQQVRDGGIAWIGNMRPHNPSRWLMEQHADWHLVYRTPEELLRLGQAVAGDGRVSLAEEPTGVNPFLVLQR
jgi:hypothetical protein